MNFKNDLISELLRIVTPALIAELNTDSSGRKKVSLSEIVKTYCEEGVYQSTTETNIEKEDSGAKILPFDRPIDEEVDEDDTEFVDDERFVCQCGPRVYKLFEDFSKLCDEMEQNLLGPSRLPKRKLNTSQAGGGNYLLEQKKRFENSYRLLKSQEVLTLYKQSAKITLFNSKKSAKKEEEEDFLADKERGVLVNKKQA